MICRLVPRCPLYALFLFSTGFLAIGCGGESTENLDKSEVAVRAALDAWKKGGAAEQLVKDKIEIVEPDWKGGLRLLDYQVKSVSNQPQQGPRVVVVLNLQDRASKKLNREVAYEVILGDKIRIGRDAFHVE